MASSNFRGLEHVRVQSAYVCFVHFSKILHDFNQFYIISSSKFAYPSTITYQPLTTKYRGRKYSPHSISYANRAELERVCCVVTEFAMVWLWGLITGTIYMTINHSCPYHIVNEAHISCMLTD